MILITLKNIFYTKGGQCVAFLLKLYEVIILPKLLCVAPIWICRPLDPLDELQKTLSHEILSLPPKVPSAMVCLDLGHFQISAIAWYHAIKFRLLLHETKVLPSLLQLLTVDSYWEPGLAQQTQSLQN